MILEDLNLLLKQIVLQLIQAGFKLTAIGKVLLGSNSYTPILKLIDEEETPTFGYRPLSRIGKLLHMDLYLVYLDDSDEELKRTIEQKNSQTMHLLKDKIANYLNNKEGIPNPDAPLNTAKLDQLLMNILGEDALDIKED